MMDLLMSLSLYGLWGTFIPLTVLALMIVFIIHATLLMIGRAFSIRELEAYAKSEILQAVATGLIAIFLVGLVDGTMTFVMPVVGMSGIVECGGEAINIAPANGAMDEAFRSIECRIQSKAQELASAQGEIHTDSMIAFKFYIYNLGISFFGITAFSGNWVPSLYKEVETYRIINTLATGMLISLNVQTQIIEYLRINMLNTFLPAGILLRSFHFSRGAGALLMSLGIGMYFIFPVFFVLLDPGYVPAPPTPPAAPQPATPNPYCYATMSSTATVLRTLEVAGGQGSTSSLSQASIKNDLAEYYVSLILHPVVALFLTLVFIRYMMTVLGGDSTELVKMVTKVV